MWLRASGSSRGFGSVQDRILLLPYSVGSASAPPRITPNGSCKQHAGLKSSRLTMAARSLQSDA